ncbi:hypothetical protein AB6A40_000241 [Gnathostoma spinigerum]|uniref:Small ribosomal subunit protein mS39 n=1 Tax=Gnathostoma spinigerum TaxID=75299 RepID=A0ABD6EA27_9BILA
MQRVCDLIIRTYCVDAAASTSLSLPRAIKRSATDLLKSLSQTVGVDKTAPHFSLIDDPVTIPTTNRARRTYYLSKEMGRRAARALAAEWPTLFMYDRDEPRLDVFRPKLPPDGSTVDPTESNLRSLVDKRMVEDAVKLYERIRAADSPVSEQLQMDLFRLLVYYNGKNVPSNETEEWHGMRNFSEIVASEWVEADLADLLFETLKKTDEVYSLMIAGLCKFPSSESLSRAENLYEEMKQKGMKPHFEAFCGLIRTSHSWHKAKSFVKDMNSMQIKPSIAIFNALIEARLKGNSPSDALADVIETVREATFINCPLNLTTFSLLLQAAEKSSDENAAVTILDQILKELDCHSSITVDQKGDHSFFLNAMKVASSANNRALIERVESIYRSENNNVKLASFTDEHTFYNDYLLYFVKVLPLDELEKMYRELVPRIVGVSRPLLFAVLDRLRYSNNWSFLRRIVEDGIAGRFMNDYGASNLMRSLLLDLNLQDLTIEEREDFAELVKRMVDAWTELSNFTDPKMSRLQVKWSPNAIAQCSLLLIKCGFRERGWNLLAVLLDDNARTGEKPVLQQFGVPSPSVLDSLMDDALRHGDWKNASLCLEVMATFLTEKRLDPVVNDIVKRCSLNKLQQRILHNFVRLRQ